MTSRYTVSLDGKDMASINDNIKKGLLILDVSYSPLEYEITENVLGALDGYEIGKVYYKRRKVTVTFELHIYNVATRNAACQAVNNWAKNGGILRINDRGGQFLSVHCETFADIESAKNWTDPLTIVFSTDTIPFWQAEKEDQKTVSGINNNAVMTVSGNIGYALVTITATPKQGLSKIMFSAYGSGSSGLVNNSTSLSQLQGTLSYVSMASAQIARSMTFSGLSLAAGETITISYTNNRYLSAVTNRNKSILGNLTKDSYDKLLVPCGKGCTFHFESNKACDVTFKVRGLYL